MHSAAANISRNCPHHRSRRSCSSLSQVILIEYRGSCQAVTSARTREQDKQSRVLAQSLHNHTIRLNVQVCALFRQLKVPNDERPIALLPDLAGAQR